MKRKFITNLSFFLVLNLLIKPIYVFGIDRVVQNKVGAEVYGKYFFLFNIALIFQIFLDLGIETFIRRETAKHPENASRFLTNIVALKILLLFPYLLICFGIAYMKGIHTEDYLLLFLILINQFLASFILYIRANIGGFQLFRAESLLSVLDRALMILIVGSLILFPLTSGKFQIKWFVLGQTVSYGLVLLVGLVFMLGRIGRIKMKFRPGELLPILNKLKPFALLVLLMNMYYRAEPIYLGLLLPDGELQTGIYAHAFRILDFLSNYALLFPLLLLPIFSKSLHKREPVGGLLELAVLLLIIPSLALLAPAIVYRNELFGLMYPDHVQLSAISFSILTVSYIGMCINYTFGALLTANGNLKQLNIMAATAVILSTVLNLILIPQHKVVGAAIANASVQLFTIIVHILLSKKIFRLRIQAAMIVKITVYILFLIFSNLLLLKAEIPWIRSSIIAIIAGILFAFSIRLLNLKSLLSIIRDRES